MLVLIPDEGWNGDHHEKELQKWFQIREIVNNMEIIEIVSLKWNTLYVWERRSRWCASPPKIN